MSEGIDSEADDEAPIAVTVDLHFVLAKALNKGIIVSLYVCTKKNWCQIHVSCLTIWGGSLTC